MKDLAHRLLDVLNDTFSHQEKICSYMERHKELLIQAKEQTDPSILDSIMYHCEMVTRNERLRIEIVGEISQLSGLHGKALDVDELAALPVLRSVREEVLMITDKLREVLLRIAQLRDQIQVLAQNALACSQMFFTALSESVTRTGPYGSSPVSSSRFISIRT